MNEINIQHLILYPKEDAEVSLDDDCNCCDFFGYEDNYSVFCSFKEEEK